jgi:hypothetical protein
MFLLYHSEGCNICGGLFRKCYINDLHTTTCSGMLGHRTGLWSDSPCLVLHKSTSLMAYSDADWAGCPDSRRSTLGYYVYYGNSLISWSSKRQTTVFRSSAEAEYRAVAHAVAECCWLRQLLQELCRHLTSATLVYYNNVSAFYMSSNHVQHRRTKHIEIDI